MGELLIALPLIAIGIGAFTTLHTEAMPLFRNVNHFVKERDELGFELDEHAIYMRDFFFSLSIFLSLTGAVTTTIGSYLLFNMM